MGNMSEPSSDAPTLIGRSVKSEPGASVEDMGSGVGVDIIDVNDVNDVNDEGDVGVGEGVRTRNGHELFAPCCGNSELLK